MDLKHTIPQDIISKSTEKWATYFFDIPLQLHQGLHRLFQIHPGFPSLSEEVAMFVNYINFSFFPLKLNLPTYVVLSLYSLTKLVVILEYICLFLYYKEMVQPKSILYTVRPKHKAYIR